MPNNIPVIVAGGATENLKTTDNGGVHTTHHNVDSLPADPFGANADAAVVTDAAGTISGKLRGLVKWAFERMPASLGIKAASASLPVQLSSDNPLPTKVSEDNSTTSVLGAAAVFTGTSEDVSKFRTVVVSVYASHASTSSGFEVQFSSNETNWDITKTYTVSATTGAYVAVPVLAQYFRVKYTNGGTLQTSFRLQTILHPTALFPSIFPAGQESLPVSGSMSLSGSLPAGTNNIGDVDVLSQPVRARTTDHIGAAPMTDAIMTGTTALTPKFAAIAASSSGNNEIVAAVTSKKIRVLNYVIVANAAVNAKWRSASTDKTGLLYLGANGGAAPPFTPTGHFETASGEALNLNLSGAVAVGGHLSYIEV